MLLALLHHLTVDVHHEAIGDGRVPEDFPDGSPFPASIDHGAHRFRVGEEAGLHEDLVIDELVVLARLDPPVEHEHLAVGVGFEDFHELKLRLQRADGTGDGVHVTFDGSGALEEPLVLQRTAHPPTVI